MRSCMLTAETTAAILLAFAAASAATADDLVALSGGKRVKVVYTDASNLGGWRSSTSQTLMGFDTDLGAPFTVIGAQANYSRPLISRDGSLIVYSDQSQRKTFRVGWDGGAKTEVAAGFTGCLWYDPLANKEYAIVAMGAAASAGNHEIWRVNVTDPGDKARLLSSHDVTAEWLAISADGTRIGGCWPWSECGVYQTSGAYTHHGSGCWPAMPYDNTYLFAIFNGPHTGWDIYRPGGGSHFLNLQPPGVGGQIYHPKFASYRSDFVVVTGPGADRPGDLYVGAVNAALTQVTAWVKVIDSDRAGPCDVWIGGAAQPPTSVSVSSFTAAPVSIVAGAPVTLSWTVLNAASVTIDNGIGTVAAQSSRTVNPLVTTTYTLTATGEGGPVQSSLTVQVLDLRAPDNTTDAVLSGLAYAYYEGTGWASLPSFPSLTPLDSGIAGGFTLDNRLRDDKQTCASP